MSGWALRSIGTPGTSFNANVTPGQPIGIQLNDILILATMELLGADPQPAVPGWTNITKNVNWSLGAAVYAIVAAGNDPMPAIPSWGNQFQVAVCLAYSGGPTTLAGLVDTSSSDRGYNSDNTLSFNPTGVPTNPNSLILAINFKNTLGNASPVLTETGGLVGFNRRVTQWPNNNRPTIVIDDLVQGAAAAILAPGMNMNFAEASAQPGRSTILVLNPAVIGGMLPGDNEFPSQVPATKRPSSLHEFWQVPIELLSIPPVMLPPGANEFPVFILRARSNVQLGIEQATPRPLVGTDRVLTPVDWAYGWEPRQLITALQYSGQGFDASDLTQVTNFAPYLEFNWFVPPGPRQWNRGYEASINLNLLGKDVVPLGAFHNLQQDPPPAVRQPSANRSYEQKALSLFFTVPAKPPLCGEWPLPILPRRPVQDFIQGIQLSQLAILSTPPPFAGSQDPPPTSRRLPAALLSFEYSRSALLRGADVVPFGLQNYQQNVYRPYRSSIYSIAFRNPFLISLVPPTGAGVQHVGRIVIPPGKLGDDFDIPFDFISGLDPGVVLVSATVTCSLYSGTDPNPAALIDGPASVSGTIAFQAVKPTILGNVYDLSCAGVTSTGETVILDAYYAVVPGVP